MGGGWIGYIYAIGGCFLVLLLLGGSTLILYAVARARGDGKTRGSATSLPRRGDDEAA
ncbi:MAG: hypothetical protein VYE22_04160 [Myxococcota bacterium]|nr:hypothetical protein [Myxococcota bacterium]